LLGTQAPLHVSVANAAALVQNVLQRSIQGSQEVKANAKRSPPAEVHSLQLQHQGSRSRKILSRLHNRVTQQESAKDGGELETNQ
jgi:hypothetical protein